MTEEKNNTQAALQEYERRLRVILEEQIARAEDMKALQKEITSAGFSHRALKRVVRAMIQADNGNEKPLAALREDAGDTALYLDRLAPQATGDGE
ncbi:MAG: hypothetical protein ACK5XN_26240 [Bacteroidota bacterium]